MNAEANEYLARFNEKAEELITCDNEHDRVWLVAMLYMLKEKLLVFGVEVHFNEA